jgi:hypothetical protein
MDLDEVRSELESLGAEAFERRYGRLFLVLTEADALESFASFVNTASRDASDLASGRSMKFFDIKPLLPRKPGETRVTIGREDADVELSASKVSKLHALFTLNGGLPSLADAGSKNGTWVNGRMLSPSEVTPIDVGDELGFGSVSATLWALDDLLAAAKPA